MAAKDRDLNIEFVGCIHHQRAGANTYFFFVNRQRDQFVAHVNSQLLKTLESEMERGAGKMLRFNRRRNHIPWLVVCAHKVVAIQRRFAHRLQGTIVDAA